MPWRPSGITSNSQRPTLTILHTTRLRLEPFGEQHLEGLHEMNKRPEVMRYISGQPETREQTAAAIARVQRCWDAWGTSWWAFIELEAGRVAGAGCVQYLRREAVGPSDLQGLRSNPLEIGWRLHPDFWRRGLASEAATRMAAFAFERFAVSELLAVRHPENLDSSRVMDRLGMRYRGLEFWYDQPLATHVLSREEWQRTVAQAGGAEQRKPAGDLLPVKAGDDDRDAYRPGEHGPSGHVVLKELDLVDGHDLHTGVVLRQDGDIRDVARRLASEHDARMRCDCLASVISLVRGVLHEQRRYTTPSEVVDPVKQARALAGEHGPREHLDGRHASGHR